MPRRCAWCTRSARSLLLKAPRGAVCKIVGGVEALPLADTSARVWADALSVPAPPPLTVVLADLPAGELAATEAHRSGGFRPHGAAVDRLLASSDMMALLFGPG